MGDLAKNPDQEIKKLNQQLQGRDKKVCEMISAVKAFTAGAAATILWSIL